MSGRRSPERTLLVHPDSSYQYYGYYLLGFEQHFGGVRFRFSRNDLPALRGPEYGLAVIEPGGRKIFIAADDHSDVNGAALAWCDVYGMVNVPLDQAGLAADQRIVPIGPSFGVRWQSTVGAWRFLASARAAGRPTFAGLPARCRAANAHQHRRLTLDRYHPGRSEPDQVFFISSAWDRHPGAVTVREAFVRAVRTVPVVEFEGGIVGGHDPSTRAERTYSTAEYVSKTQSSLLVYNTPAVHGCLGWKLGEYLALGKAMLSLPISKSLPEPLAHGSNVHFVDGDADALVDAIGMLRSDHAYRRGLEHGARDYFDRWLAPQVVAARLLG
jgi:glycosyltransferase involved in cell wall biosynthesis